MKKGRPTTKQKTKQEKSCNNSKNFNWQNQKARHWLGNEFENHLLKKIQWKNEKQAKEVKLPHVNKN